MKVKNVESKLMPRTTRTVKTKMGQELVPANIMNIRLQLTELRLSSEVQQLQDPWTTSRLSY